MDDARRKAWLDRHLTKHEREQFDKAEKIPDTEWTGVALCVPPGDDNGYFFTEVAEIANRFDADSDHFPVFAWDCDMEPFTLTRRDAESMIEDQLQDHHEDAVDKITTAQWEELATFLAGWAERTGIVSWHPNMKRAVMLTPPETDEQGGDS